MPNALQESAKRKATWFAFAGNSFLFVLKLSLGLISGSIAVISDAIHSLLDIVATIIIAIGIKVGREKADAEHPFGHHRAEPIAGLIIAVIAGILAVEVVQEAVTSLFKGEREILGTIAMLALALTILTKVIMAWYLRRLSKKVHSSSVRALAIDSRNDVLATSVALAGVFGAELGFSSADALAGIVVAVFIFKGGWEIGLENIDYLMGKTADEEVLRKIRFAALSVKGVLALNTLRSHYVGNKIHVEIHIEVDHLMTTRDSHQISDDVESAIESLEDVSKAFVHVDPVKVLSDGTRVPSGFHEKHPELE
ncbi:MAG: cation diffusion facilitator family transporter [Bacteroidetes bacterium]|nr:cation diffusion facilitator family transporter [Bacteroidota bacterium]